MRHFTDLFSNSTDILSTHGFLLTFCKYCRNFGESAHPIRRSREQIEAAAGEM